MALGYGTRRYGTTVDGTEVEIDFDRSLVVLNRITLLIDGRPVDRRSVFYGTTRLHGELLGEGASRQVSVDVRSGVYGQLVEATLDGREEQPLTPR